MGPDGGGGSSTSAETRRKPASRFLRVSTLCLCSVFSALVTANWDRMSPRSWLQGGRILLASEQSTEKLRSAGEFVESQPSDTPAAAIELLNTVDLASRGPESAGSRSGNSLPAEIPEGGLSDDVLFRAVAEAERKEGSKPRKLAFLFLTPGPLPLAKLWCQFLYGHEGLYTLYVHAGPQHEFQPGDVPHCFFGTQIPSKDTTSHAMATVDAQLRLLAHALLDKDNARFIFVSESCIPIFNFFFIYNYLIATQSSFVQGNAARGLKKSDRWHSGFLPLIKQGDWRTGTPWMALTRDLALLIVNDTEYYNAFKQRCRKCCCAEDHFFSTVLHRLAPSQIANRSLTWTEWSSHIRSWVSFKKPDARPSLIDHLRGKHECTWNENGQAFCFLFGRKLDPEALEPLLTLGSAMGY